MIHRVLSCLLVFLLVGDLVATIMNDSGTPEVADDIVVSVRYVGWIDEAYIDNWVRVGTTE